VISRRGAGLLELASKRGAKTVRVSLRPAKKGHTSAPRVTKSCR
jgi:hypothetical protein